MCVNKGIGDHELNVSHEKVRQKYEIDEAYAEYAQSMFKIYTKDIAGRDTKTNLLNDLADI